MLHVRWFHASAARMIALFKAGGIPTKTLERVQPIVDTCRVCRQWTKPGNRSMTSTRFSTEFNETVQVDLLWVLDTWLLHAIDEATRWSMVTPLSGRTPKDICKAFHIHWIGIFGAPRLIISDQEMGLVGDEGRYPRSCGRATPRVVATTVPQNTIAGSVGRLEHLFRLTCSHNHTGQECDHSMLWNHALPGRVWPYSEPT